MERRRHKRFSATAFINTPVFLEPLPPYFGNSTKGTLIDLSAGGMAILIDEFIPAMARLNLMMSFPDKTRLESIVEIKHVLPKDKSYLIGIEFLTLPVAVQQRVDSMSSDYIDCETRIKNKETEICRPNCAFFNMCTKAQRMIPLINVDVSLNLAFEQIKEKTFQG